jgi:hypothetical protein
MPEGHVCLGSSCDRRWGCRAMLGDPLAAWIAVHQSGVHSEVGSSRA